MRKMKWKNFALLTLSVGMLCSCGGGSGVSLEKGKQIFEGNNIYFETGTSENVSAKVEIPEAIQSVKCGRTEAQKGEYCYEDGILTLSHEFLAKINSTGEKSIVVAMSKGKVTLSALIATKIVKTAEDFVAIGKDSVSLQGSYVLANDIDLSSIENFEPLGWYTDEADPNNAYFHGLLEGYGHAVKNAKVYYADSLLTTALIARREPCLNMKAIWPVTTSVYSKSLEAPASSATPVLKTSKSVVERFAALSLATSWARLKTAMSPIPVPLKWAPISTTMTAIWVALLAFVLAAAISITSSVKSPIFNLALAVVIPLGE